MSDFHDNSKANELDQAVIHELHELCSRLHDRMLSDEQHARFNTLLDNSQAARRLYLRYVSLHSTLLACTGKHQQIEVEAISRHVTALAWAEEANTKKSRTAVLVAGLDSDAHSTRRSLAVTLAIAASLLIAASAAIWTLYRSSDTVASATKTNEVAKSIGAAAVLSENTKPVARLSYVSPTARWRQHDTVFDQEADVLTGNLLALATGEIELTYRTGTRLLLIGPAEFLIEATGGKLRRGGLVASVTEKGRGFTIETPNGKIVDLGTEFGVVVDDFGVSEVSVFQGKVEAFPNGGNRKGKKIELTKGSGMQWSQDDFISLDADLRRFAASVLDRPTGGDRAEGLSSVVDHFRAATLDTTHWKTLGDVRPTTAGLQLFGSGDFVNQPYLISAEQYDPSQGPITVTCDFRFGDVGSVDAPTFSILTRSADQRGTAPQPWNDTLASCVRCSFGSETDSGEGRLRAGVKLEGDREVARNTWSSFLQPKAGTPYRVVMRDDGVNVSFTVSLRDKPSTARTVTCRSLFRGKVNYVAMEGSSVGTILIERVEISQDRWEESISSYADFSSLLLNSRMQREMEKQQLAALAPDDAVLVLEDSFEAEQLNAERWTYLGDVVLHEGAVQLGLPNLDAHIDTWKARPYLLVRDPLNPNMGTVTVIGKIRFAGNFLTGYGASFAVMTRADDRRGQGPGWENSVLQRGVRANFWPAAWDSEHSLEIHEKPAPNTITLLATQGMQVDPSAHSYLFRVVDDGQFVSLTIVDPKKPEATMTISSPTTSALNQGYLGFESSWGSPVTLDDVRIYQSRQSAHNTPISPSDE